MRSVLVGHTVGFYQCKLSRKNTKNLKPAIKTTAARISVANSLKLLTECAWLDNGPSSTSKVGKSDEKQCFALPAPPLPGKRPCGITFEAVCLLDNSHISSHLLGAIPSFEERSDEVLWPFFYFFSPREVGFYLQQCKEMPPSSGFLRFT